ncbi:hypothetical protein DAEQUDRAFT_769618 [Daedalea quercina L-15889]|uniref:Uncharacterized protein n=1 Tax=Daedalea quercina L-15889 TaxID=1314783 RepID=A0A165LL13_9APHY|nr:hypothetical protein DAEQUDRAFT_769618 [Daedalea quercina L-15889]
MTYKLNDWPALPFGHLPELPEDDNEDLSYTPSSGICPQRRSDEEKAFEVLKYMCENLSRFSLRTFLTTLLISDSGEIKNTVNTWKVNGGIPELLDILWAMSGLRDDTVCTWVTDKAAAAKGPHTVFANMLRAPARTLSVVQLKSFMLHELGTMYSQTMPQTRTIFKAIMNKDHTV